MLARVTTKKPESPFAALDALRAKLPPGEKPAPRPPAPPPKPPARAVIRLEKKQRRGKEVTVVDKLGLGPAELARWCKELKQALGCGGVVDGDVIILQGDLRPRLAAVLTARGVAKVITG